MESIAIRDHYNDVLDYYHVLLSAWPSPTARKICHGDLSALGLLTHLAAKLLLNSTVFL